VALPQASKEQETLSDRRAGTDQMKMSSPRALLLARIAWLAVAGLIIFLFSFGVPAYYRQLQIVCTAQPCYSAPTPDRVRDLQAAGLSIVFAARYVVALDLITALVYGAVAAIIFWRKSNDHMALFVAFALLTFGTFGVHDFEKIQGILIDFHPLWGVPVASLGALGGVLFSLLFFIFPDGRFVPGWLRWPAAVWITLQTMSVFLPGTLLDPASWPALPNILYWSLFLGLCAYAQIYRFRNVSSYQQRQQTKWVVLGAVATAGGSVLAITLTGLAQSLRDNGRLLALVQDTGYYPFLLLIPLSIGVAIFRSRLYDVDVVINRALVYAALTTLLALIYGGLVVGLQAVFSLFTGPTPTLAVIISTLATVAVVQPLRRSLQAFIDRRFYRRKYDAKQVLASTASRLRDEVNLDDLTSIAGSARRQFGIQTVTPELPRQKKRAREDLDPLGHNHLAAAATAAAARLIVVAAARIVQQNMQRHGFHLLSELVFLPAGRRSH
jgi:hypothetical protein